MGHGSGVAAVGDVGDGFKSLGEKGFGFWVVPILPGQLQRLFLMRLETQHGFHISQIIVCILTTLQAIPNHRVNVFKCVSVVRVILLKNQL